MFQISFDVYRKLHGRIVGFHYILYCVIIPCILGKVEKISSFPDKHGF